MVQREKDTGYLFRSVKPSVKEHAAMLSDNRHKVRARRDSSAVLCKQVEKFEVFDEGFDVDPAVIA